MSQSKSNGHGRKSTGGDYFYAQGQKIGVEARRDLVAVQFHARAAQSSLDVASKALGRGLARSDEFPEMQASNLRIYRREEVASDVDTRQLAKQLSEVESVEKVGDVYVNQHGQPLVLTDEIVVKFQQGSSSEQIEQIRSKFGLEVVESLPFSENAFVLRTRAGQRRDALEIANELVEAGQATYAHPNWIEHVGYRTQQMEVTPSWAKRERTPEARHGVHPTDPSFPQQWHLENMGQTVGGVVGTPGADIRATLAWQITMGNPAIRLAVIDGGVDIAHTDFNSPGKSVDPIDFMVTPPDNNPVGGSHGTQVAGMAVASANNAAGGTGSAPNCRLIAIKAGDTFPQVLMAKAFVYAADRGADVITCSLGPNGTPWTMHDVLRDAIEYASTYGRNGRGCLYTQAIDNTGVGVNIDQVASFERAVAVGRTNNRDTYDGSATGPELDLCAPGRDVLTTTNTTAGAAGAAAMVTTTGTSFSAPLTAGVGCLVLSINPALSWEETRQVLFDSADKIDTTPYVAAGPGLPPGTRNDRCGYGRVNAERAVQIAGRATTRDLYVRDNPTDDGSVPQPSWGFWDSPDIWVRNADDGGTAHENTLRGQDNFLHARVHNRGTQASHAAWVRFYITTFAGSQFSYPYDYKPDTSSLPGGTPGNLKASSVFPAPGAYLVGVARIASVPAGGSAILKTRWPAALIPPSAGWHPCLLVEVSPHDGPLPVGQYVWENNNLGQKNITIVDAPRGRWLKFPFRIGHAQAAVGVAQLEVRPAAGAKNWPLALGFEDAGLLEKVVKQTGLPAVAWEQLPALSVDNGLLASPLGLNVKPALADLGGPTMSFPQALTSQLLRPLRLTFLEQASMAVALGEGRGGGTIALRFPAGATLELGGPDELSAEAQQQEPGAGEPEPEDDRIMLMDRPSALASVLKRPTLQVAKLGQAPVVSLAPGVTSKLSVPMLKGGQALSDLNVFVPESARPGDVLTFDVAQRDAGGQLVGGVRLQVRVTG